MNQAYQKLTKVLGNNRVFKDEPLVSHTYIKIGGPADLFFTASSRDDLLKAIKTSLKLQIPYFILGGGSNILVSDKGFRGLVIKNRTQKISLRKYTGKVAKEWIKVNLAEVVAQSGVITNLLVRRTIDQGLSGLEYFLGVPGTIGGAVYNNSHYQTELIGNFVKQVEVLDKNGREKLYTKQEMKFDYDYSITQETKETILSVTFLLKGGNKDQLWKKAESFAKKRSSNQPLNFPSSGCIFKNPGQIRKKVKSENKQDYAGYLIDKAGLKGLAIGGAQVSEKHANFIINTGKATAQDVMNLVKNVRKRVQEKFNVDLQMEVIKVGDFE